MDVMPPKRSGKKAVVFKMIEVLVEVEESDSYYDMVEQADEKLRKHVVDGKGFIPYRSTTTMIQESTTVNELVQKLTIQPGRGWND